MSHYGGGANPGVLGNKIRELRKARGWTAIRLSSATHGIVSRHAIAKLENNFQDNVSVAQGLALAHALGVSVEQLLDEQLPASALVIAAEIADAKERLLTALVEHERLDGKEEQ